MPERKIERICPKCGKTFYCEGDCDYRKYNWGACICGKCLGATKNPEKEAVCDLAFAPKVKVILI